MGRETGGFETARTPHVLTVWRLFCLHFKIGRCDAVPGHKIILQWVHT